MSGVESLCSRNRVVTVEMLAPPHWAKAWRETAEGSDFHRAPLGLSSGKQQCPSLLSPHPLFIADGFVEDELIQLSAWHCALHRVM